MRLQHDTLTVEDATPYSSIGAINATELRSNAEIVTSGLQTCDAISRSLLQAERGRISDFNAWMLQVSKGSFGAVTLADLRSVENDIRHIFEAITYDDGEARRFNELYDSEEIASRIRLAFHPKRSLRTTCEILQEDAHLLIVTKLRNVASNQSFLYPSEADCEKVLEIDAARQDSKRVYNFAPSGT